MAEALGLAVVSLGVEKLCELLSVESARLLGIKNQADELKGELRRLEALVKDVDARKFESESVKIFLEEVKDIIYDAEDVIEFFFLKETGGRRKRFTKSLRRLPCFIGDRRKIASEVEDITERITKVIGRMQIIDGGSLLFRQQTQRHQRESRQTFPYSSENNLVGLDQSVNLLVRRLVGTDSAKLVSISGMGGIGKTTLARQVFNDSIVRHHFEGFAWVCVSQQFTQKDVWQRILQALKPESKVSMEVDGRHLFQLLETGKYLIVLDDVWTKEDWDRIKEVFPAERDSKILLTSRNESVALHADPNCFAFRPRGLTDNDSWKLCEKIVFPRRDQAEFGVDEQLEAMGKEMVTHCGGLPLAVKLLGGLLVGKHTVPEWKRVQDNIRTRLTEKSGLDDNNLNCVLSLSYDDLPMQLKHGFLYLALFHPHQIEVEKLFYFWAVDGILPSLSDGATIQACGEDCLEELVRRNMVILEKEYDKLRVEYCRMHDMMREFCLSKAKEENFHQVISGVPTSTSSIRSRKLVVRIGSNASEVLGHLSFQKVRSLLFSSPENDVSIHSAQDFKSMPPLLRVLDLSRVIYKKGRLPSSVGELIHLRFLSLYGGIISHIPSSLRNLRLLIYLNLRCKWHLEVHVPNVFKEMLELRFLYLPHRMDDRTKLELGNLVKLESLTNFSMKHSEVTDLICMSKLKILHVICDSGCSIEILFPCLHLLRDLETFTCVGNAVALQEFPMDLINLKELVLEMRIPRLPAQHLLSPHLSIINLTSCKMEEDPMTSLEKLPHLIWLHLTDTFSGRRMVCSNGGFPQLRYLSLTREAELEEWIVEQGSMPCLLDLSIYDCRKLKDYPDGLRHISSLEELTIGGLMWELEKKLTPGGEHHYKVQHIPKVCFLMTEIE